MGFKRPMAHVFNKWDRPKTPELDLCTHKPDGNMLYLRTIPIKVQSEQNMREHWAIANKRHQNQKLAIRSFMDIDSPEITMPCTIKLIRIAPREMDEDNVIYSFKYVKDQIADYIKPGLAPGRADDDKRMTWLYSQEKGEPRYYAIRIEITRDEL